MKLRTPAAAGFALAALAWVWFNPLGPAAAGGVGESSDDWCYSGRIEGFGYAIICDGDPDPRGPANGPALTNEEAAGLTAARHPPPGGPGATTSTTTTTGPWCPPHPSAAAIPTTTSLQPHHPAASTTTTVPWCLPAEG